MGKTWEKGHATRSWRRVTKVVFAYKSAPLKKKIVSFPNTISYGYHLS